MEIVVLLNIEKKESGFSIISFGKTIICVTVLHIYNSDAIWLGNSTDYSFFSSSFLFFCAAAFPRESKADKTPLEWRERYVRRQRR